MAIYMSNISACLGILFTGISNLTIVCFLTPWFYEGIAVNLYQRFEFYKFLNDSNIAFAVSVLQLMKSSQAQHGLRHGDYARYRY